jgi:hypothetical protein
MRAGRTFVMRQLVRGAESALPTQLFSCFPGGNVAAIDVNVRAGREITFHGVNVGRGRRPKASQFFQSASGLSAMAPSTRQDTDVANDPLATRLPDSPADPQ